MKNLFILLLLTSCISPNQNIIPNNNKLDFDEDLSFEDFNELLIEYAITSPYPVLSK